MAKTSTYWDKRAIKRLTQAEKSSEEYINRIKKMYDQANKDLDREIAKIYKNYSKDTGIDVQTLKQLLTHKETSKVFKELKAKGYDKYVRDNYKSRITRLEQIKAQIYSKAKEVYTKEELLNHDCYKNVVNNSYYKSIYDTQMGTGYDFSFNKLDDNLLNGLLRERWSGKNYSQRIWGNTDILAESVSEIVGGALLSGQSISKTAKQIKDRYGVSKYYAERLVRTETNHFNNEADAMAYEEMGVNEYVFVAVLDSRTSPMCQDHDNQVYKYKDREVGVNYPPLHPNCRSTTRGYLGKEAEKMLKRRARDPQTGKSELIDNMSYKEWAKSKGIINDVTPVAKSDKKVAKATNNKTVVDTTKLKNALNDIELKNRNLTHEMGTVLDVKGNILGTYDGGDHEVDVGDKSLLKDNIFTHNHPTKGTFSTGDIDSFIKYDLKELRASTDTEVYSLTRLGDKHDPRFLEEFKKQDYEFYKKASAEINQLWAKNELDFNPREQPNEYLKLIAKTKGKYYDEWLLENAKNFGYKYEKIPLIDKAVKPKTVESIIKPLTNVDKQALEYYVSGEGMYVNNVLRGVNKEMTLNAKDMELIKDLDNATNRPANISKLYRSVDASVIFPNIDLFDYDDLKGYINYGANGNYATNKFNKIMSTQVKEFKDLGFVSCTKDYEIASNWGDFTGSDKPIVLELNLDKTVKGVDLDFLDMVDDPQKETLLARNQIFKVRDIKSKDGNIYVVLDVTNKK